MISLFICFIFKSFCKQSYALSENLPSCSPGIVNTNCKTKNYIVTGSDPLTTYFQEFILNANISFSSCTFKKFKSQINDIAGIISISNEQNDQYFASFQDCAFEDNQLSSPILTISKVQVSFVFVDFSDNIINQGSMIKLTGQIYFMFSCQFNRNKISEKPISFQDTSISFLISIYDNSLVHIQNCCFLIDSNNFVFNLDDSSQITVSKNTIFNCPISRIYPSYQKKLTSFQFDHTTVYSGNKCSSSTKGTNTTDPSNPPDDSDDKEKKISKYLYIGIGSAAGAIVLGIIIFLIFRIAGKCKTLEKRSTDEGVELADRRTAYLLQDGEQGEEIIPKEQENSLKDNETHTEDNDKNATEL